MMRLHQAAMPSRPEVLTPAQLRDLLVTVIAGVKEEPEAKWRKIVGDVEKLPLAYNVQSNWRVTPAGTPAQRKVVEQCVDIVRGEHPYVSE